MSLKRILNYWPEALVFGVVSSVLMVCISPDLTFMNMAADGPAYVMSAKYLYPAHHTSAPLYLLLGHLFILIPIGTEYWRLALMSAVFAVGSLVFIYLISRNLFKENKRARWFALLGVLVFGSSMMLISQAIIAETYTLVTFFGLGAYYFTLKKNWVLVAVMLGLGLAVHHLILITWLVLLIFNKDLRRWKPIAITMAFVLFYLYIPLSKAFTDAPVMWLNTGLKAFIISAFSTFMNLIGGVAIWDFPKRILETIGFLGVSLTIGFIVLIWYVMKVKLWSKPLFWLFLLPIIYGGTSGDPHVSRYALPGYAFGGVIIALGLSKVKPVWLYSTGIAAIVMLGINANYFDLGRTLDKHLTAARFYREEYPKVADGQIFMTFLPGGEWQQAFYYNKKEGRNIIPICIGMLANPAYQTQLKSQGVQLTGNTIANQTDNEMEVALSIIDQNQDVLIAKSTTPRDYGAVLVPALENKQEITMWQGYVTVPKWKFIPSNPYDILTGAIDTTDWRWTLRSTWDVKFFVSFGSLGLILNWLVFILPNRKVKVENSIPHKG